MSERKLTGVQGPGPVLQPVADAPAPALFDEPDSETILFEDPDIPSDERAGAADLGDTLPDWLQDLDGEVVAARSMFGCLGHTFVTPRLAGVT